MTQIVHYCVAVILTWYAFVCLFVQIRGVDYKLHPAASPRGSFLCLRLLAPHFCPPHASVHQSATATASEVKQHEHHHARLRRTLHSIYWSGNELPVCEAVELAEQKTTAPRGSHASEMVHLIHLIPCARSCVH
jgi:hypothetical protein